MRPREKCNSGEPRRGGEIMGTSSLRCGIWGIRSLTGETPFNGTTRGGEDQREGGRQATRSQKSGFGFYKGGDSLQTVKGKGCQCALKEKIAQPVVKERGTSQGGSGSAQKLGWGKYRIPFAELSEPTGRANLLRDQSPRKQGERF